MSLIPLHIPATPTGIRRASPESLLSSGGRPPQLNHHPADLPPGTTLNPPTNGHSPKLEEPPIPRARTVVPGFDAGTSVPSPMGLLAKVGPHGTLFCEQEPYREDYQDTAPWQNLEVYDFNGIPKSRDFPKSLRADFEARMKVSPREFFRTLFEGSAVRLGGGQMTVDRDGDGIHSVDLQMDLMSPTSQRVVGRMDREFCFSEDGSAKVYHSLFDLDRKLQGKGVARELLANSVKLYDGAGVKSVGVFAALGVGGYAWAKYGFKPKPGQETTKLFATIGSRLAKFEKVPSSVRTVVESLLKKGDPSSIWAISDLDGVKVKQAGKDIPLGKALLLGTVWRGSLDLDDPQARARFDQYVHQSPASPRARL